MILTHGVKVCLATRPCDLRKSFDTLSVVVHDELREDPLSRKVFVFLNRNTRIRPKSGLGQALQYALGQWPAMQTFLEGGRVDNNDTENDIRPSAVGKKNGLFVGSPEAGQRSAVMYTLLISARNHGVDPQAYLQDVIERLPVTRPDEPDALLPANWAAANRAIHPAIKSGDSQAA